MPTSLTEDRTKNAGLKFIGKSFFNTLLGRMGNVFGDGTYKSGQVIKIIVL